jgi:hypothetical protein
MAFTDRLRGKDETTRHWNRVTGNVTRCTEEIPIDASGWIDTSMGIGTTSTRYFSDCDKPAGRPFQR